MSIGSKTGSSCRGDWEFSGCGSGCGSNAGACYRNTARRSVSMHADCARLIYACAYGIRGKLRVIQSASVDSQKQTE